MPGRQPVDTVEIAEARDSEAREFFKEHKYPADKPDFLTRQQWGMLDAHVRGGESYDAVGETFGGVSGDRVRGIIGRALERFAERA